MLKRRLPTRAELILLFAVCVFPTHVISIINLLNRTPSYLLRLTASELLSVFSYTLAFTLVESLVLLGLLVLFGALTPPRYFKEQIVSQGTLVVFSFSLWALVFKYMHLILQALSPLWGQIFNRASANPGAGASGWVSSDAFLFLVLWALWLVTLILVSPRLIRQRPKLKVALESFADRLSVLSYTFVFFDGFGIVVILIRNLVRS
jgi:hypothetical protein